MQPPPALDGFGIRGPLSPEPCMTRGYIVLRTGRVRSLVCIAVGGDEDLFRVMFREFERKLATFCQRRQSNVLRRRIAGEAMEDDVERRTVSDVFDVPPRRARCATRTTSPPPPKKKLTPSVFFSPPCGLTP
jgi:hypothetical protein